MSYQEPAVIFCKDAKKGRELAKAKNWIFCGGNSTLEMAHVAADTFRTGAKNGIVLTYFWAITALNLRRPNTQLVLIDCPDQNYSLQAMNRVRPISIIRVNSSEVLLSSKHQCHCSMQIIQLRGCQCGGE